MTRPNHNFNSYGPCKYTPEGQNPQTNMSLAFSSIEQTSGTSRRKPKGFIPPTSYSYFKETITSAVGHLYWDSPTVNYLGFKYNGVIGGATGAGGAFISSSHFDYVLGSGETQDASLSNVALIKARASLKRSSVNLGVAFAERSKTARLVGDTAINLARAYRDLRRGEIRNAMDRLGISSARGEPRGSNAPQKWLELQYGWKPLLSDVYGACEALNGRHKSDWRVTAKGRAQSNRVITKMVPDQSGIVTARLTNSCFVRIDALPKNEAIISLASLGITNPLLIGWELVPFSFVVDWFLPVGGWLEGVDALLGYEDFSYSSSLLTRCEWIGNGVGKKSFPPFYELDAQYTESKSLVRLERSVGHNVPFPAFPRFKDPRSLEHMANGLALLATVFGRR